MKRLSPLLTPLLLLIYLLASAWPAWRGVQDRSGRDYATYHYAAHALAAGEDPYDKQALGVISREEKTRNSVHPYFYPPPFLVATAWMRWLDLPTGYRLSFWLSQAALGGVLWSLRRWLGSPWPLLLLVSITLTPLADSAKMGQANLWALAPAVAGLWLRNGGLVGLAGMLKMSPALYLAGWVATRQWRPALVAAATAVGLGLLSLAWVPWEQQWRFYTEILPGFSSGEYNGLRVPMDLPANHSIPDLLNQLWPGPDRHTLSVPARRLSSLASLGLLLLVAGLGRGARTALQQANLMGALTVVMLITPVYCYEHHLSMMVLPGAALATALWTQAAPRWTWAAALVAWFFVAWPLYWLRPLQAQLPPLRWILQESKFLGMLAVGALCLWAARRPSSGDADQGLGGLSPKEGGGP
jgi:Glycosyltransferase family 87